MSCCLGPIRSCIRVVLRDGNALASRPIVSPAWVGGCMDRYGCVRQPFTIQRLSIWGLGSVLHPAAHNVRRVRSQRTTIPCPFPHPFPHPLAPRLTLRPHLIRAHGLPHRRPRRPGWGDGMGNRLAHRRSPAPPFRTTFIRITGLAVCPAVSPAIRCRCTIPYRQYPASFFHTMGYPPLPMVKGRAGAGHGVRAWGARSSPYEMRCRRRLFEWVNGMG